MRIATKDEKIIQQAVQNLAEATGKKPSVSKAIRAGLEIMANTSPIPELFYCNKVGIWQLGQNVEAGMKNLQGFYDEFLKTTGGNPITLDEIQKLFGIGRTNYGVCDKNRLRELIIDKMLLGQSANVGNLKLDESTLRSLIVIPDLEPLFEAGNKVFDVPMVFYKDRFFWEVYEIKEDKVVIIPDQVEQIKNSFRAFATTPHEKQKLAKAQELCELLGRLKEGEVFNPEKLNLKGVAFWDSESGRYEPDPQFVIYGLQETLFFTH